MTLKDFFKTFDLFADAPNAIPQMRRFILDLAVRGKLVRQNASDEPADELLKRIQTEKMRLVKVGELKKQEKLPPVTNGAISFSLSAGWAVTQLGDIAACLDYMREPVNGTDRESRIAGKDQSELFPYYGATQQQGWIDDYIFNDELVLLGEDGVPFFDALRPKAYLISGKTWVNNHAHVFRGILVSNQFLVHWLNTFDYTGRVAGTTRSKLNQARAVDIPIPLPPLAEQHRIVAKVDELMALCDQLEAQQQERETRHAGLVRASLSRFAEAPTPANLNLLFHKSYTIDPADLRKSILTLAVQGKLASQDPTDEFVEELLNPPIKAERKTTRWARPITDEEVPFRLPGTWRWMRLGDLATLKHGYAFSSEYFTSEPAPFVLTTPGNFYERGGFRDRESKRKYYTGPVDPEFILKPRDFIIPMTEQAAGLLGSPAFIPDNGRIYIHNQRLGKLSFSKSVSPEFAFWFFNCEFFRDELARTCTGMKVRHTSPDRILSVPFPVCPLAEQRRIVTKVDELMALMDALETQLTASRTKAAQLMEAVVAELTSKN